jgi:5-methylcytosine-specific restriction endonuclease McrA
VLDRTCIACLRPLEPGRRADATTCDRACYTWARRHPGVTRPTGLQSYTCKYCSGTFTRPGLVPGNQPRFCGDVCWDAWRHRNNRPWGYWRVADPFEPRPFVCADCGIKAMDSGRGPRAAWCSHCTLIRDRARAPEWAARNPAGRREISRNYSHRRRAQILGTAVEDFTAVEVFVADNWVCQLCKQPVDQQKQFPNPLSPSLDHIIPLSRGGGHVRSNVQLAHYICNVRKGSSLP